MGLSSKMSQAVLPWCLLHAGAASWVRARVRRARPRMGVQPHGRLTGPSGRPTPVLFSAFLSRAACGERKLLSSLAFLVSRAFSDVLVSGNPRPHAAGQSRGTVNLAWVSCAAPPTQPQLASPALLWGQCLRSDPGALPVLSPPAWRPELACPPGAPGLLSGTPLLAPLVCFPRLHCCCSAPCPTAVGAVTCPHAGCPPSVCSLPGRPLSRSTRWPVPGV